MDTALLRQHPDRLPPDLQVLLRPDTARPPGVAFFPLRRVALGGEVLAATLVGTPALLVLLAVIWGVIRVPFGPLLLLGLGLVAAAAFWVLVAQGLRVQQAWRRRQQQQARLLGHEGLYVGDGGWLLLVHTPGRISLLPRDSVRCVQEVRVRYQRRREAFCETWPCVALHDGRRVILQTPPLVAAPDLDTLLAGWQLPVEARRLDITEAQLRDFSVL